MTCKSISKALGYIAACGVLALGLATAPQAGAVSFGGNLAGAQDGSVTSALPGTYNFSADFVDADVAGDFLFKFKNSGASNVVLTFLDVTIGQLSNQFFSGGVGTTFGPHPTRNSPEKISDVFQLSALVGPGDMVNLVFDYGDPTAPSGAGPNIDFRMTASVIPLPAGLVLFLSGLAGIGFLGRYKAKRREPAVA